MLYINDELDKIKDEEVNALICTFPEQRKLQALKFKHAQGRKECAVAYMLLCKGLREEFGIEEMPVFKYSEHGKPSIVGHDDIHFNISHCKKCVACYISREPVGIDVECIGRGTEDLINYTMNEDEVEMIKHATDPKTEFIRLWTRKEAVLKLTSEGINDNMKEVLSPTRMKNITLTSTVREDKGYVYSLAFFSSVG